MRWLNAFEPDLAHLLRYDRAIKQVTPMTEFVPAAQPKARLSFEDRLYIIQTVNALPPQQFDELVFALDPPKGIIPPESAAQGSRSKALLDWVESPTGPGLAVIDKYLQKIIPKATKTAARLTAFAISGRLGDLSTAEIEAIVQLLRQKTGDDSIDLAFYEEGSIKLVLNGSAEGLEKLQELFEAGELAGALEDVAIEYAHPLTNDTTTARKARLIEVLRSRALASRIALTRSSNLTRDLIQELEQATTLATERARIIDSSNATHIARVVGRIREYADTINPANVQDSNYASTIGWDIESVKTIIETDNDSIGSDLALAVASTLTAVSVIVVTSIIAANPMGIVIPIAVLGILATISIHSINRVRKRTSRATRALTRDFKRAIAHASDLAAEVQRIVDLEREYALDKKVDLSEVDLSGANLKGINLKGVPLVETNLNHAIVEEAIFGDNLGLSEAAKDDLRRRGAIIQDTPGSNTPALVRR